MVDDEGPGIAEYEARRLLQPFVQGANQSGAGFGLGLALPAALSRPAAEQ